MHLVMSVSQRKERKRKLEEKRHSRVNPKTMRIRRPPVFLAQRPELHRARAAESPRLNNRRYHGPDTKTQDFECYTAGVVFAPYFRWFLKVS